MGKISGFGNLPDNVRLYLEDLKYCEILSKEEQLLLIQRYQKGDTSVLNRILESNLRLVVSVVKVYINKLVYVDFLDLIQEGNLALLKAIETYNPEKSEFGTYATFLIQNKIKSFLSVSNCSIERPEYLENLILRYKKLYSEYKKKGLALPCDKDLCELLNVTSSQLKLIREELPKTSVSLNQPIDDDSMTLQDTIVDATNQFEELISKVDDKKLLLMIKEVLTPMEYYVLYHRVLSSVELTLEKIGNEFSTTYENIRRIEKDALTKVKECYCNSRKRKLVENKLKSKYENLDWLNCQPISPKDFLKYRYIEPTLDDLERKLYYMLYVERHEYPVKFLIQNLGITTQDYDILLKKLSLKIVNAFSNAEDYLEFENRSFRTLKTTIFKKTLEKESMFDFEKIETFLNMDTLDDKTKSVLENAFHVPSTTMSFDELEYRFHSFFLGYESVKNIEYKEDLYDFYQTIKNTFTEEQQLFIESYFFSVSSFEEYKEKFPQKKCLQSRKDLEANLEKMFFEIPDFRSFDFQKEDYLEIRKMDVLKENYRNILDSYFEITEQKFAFSDSELHNAKMVALNAFLGRTKNRIFQKENYIPYLEDSSFEFDENTLKILKMFFVENLTLKGIRERMNITVSPMKLSNIITDSVDRIDKTRFGIVTSHSIDCSKVKEFLQMDSLNDSEKTIFQFKYLSNLKVEDIAKEIGKSSKFVFSVLTRLNKKFLSFQAQDVVISEEEIFSEVSLHPSESVLDKDANTILSLLYGFKNTWNPSGKKLSVNEIAQIYKVRNIKINFQINKYLEDLKLKKIGLLKKDLCYMKREELDILLDDVHVPIREEERDIICKLFGLKGSPYTSLSELAFEKSEKSTSIRQKYNNAMLKLFRYLNHEISGELSFLDDIKPNLSYFSKKDQVILFDYYQNKKTIREIASSYSCTESQIKYRLLKIEYQLVSFLHNKKIFKIPFDSVDKIVSNEKFLYEGDKVQMKKVFDLYFGQSSFQTKTIEEIIKLLDLPFERVTLQKKLLDFLISICKYEYGIRKQNAITSEDIKSFFIKNKIQNPFDSLNYRILCDVLKSKHTDYIDFSSNSKDRILEILKGKKKNKIPQAIRLELCAHFQIRNYELMNAKDQKKIYKILESLQKNRAMSLKMSK